MKFSPNLEHVFKVEHVFRLQLLAEYATEIPGDKEVGDRRLGAKQDNTPGALKSLMELAEKCCGETPQKITLDDRKPDHKENGGKKEKGGKKGGESGRPSFLTIDGTRTGKLDPSLIGRYLSLDAYYHQELLHDINSETTEFDNLNFQMFLFFHCFERVQFGYPAQTLRRSSGFTVKEVETIAYCLLRGGDINMLNRVFPYLDGEQLANFVDNFSPKLFAFDYGELMSDYFDTVLSKTHHILFRPLELKDEAEEEAAVLAAVERFEADEKKKKESANI